MKIHCPKSGLQYSTQHFSGAASQDHPVFTLEQHKLLAHTAKWAAGELPPTDSYLLFLALLDSTQLIIWRTSTIQQDDIIASNMEALIRVIGKINLIHHPAFVLPRFVVSLDTASLGNVHHWIQAWEGSYEEFMNGYRNATEQERIKRREYALERMIKSTQLRNTDKYARALAVWAATAGHFPTFLTQHPITQHPVALAEYWKEIITHCTKENKIYLYPDTDIQELLEHCEEHIPHGSIYAHSLMDLLRSGKKKQIEFLSLPDFDFDSYKAGLTPQEHMVESANKAALIESAPLNEPCRQDYASEFEFTKAKMKWMMKIKYTN